MTKQEIQKILIETVKRFSDQEWFRDATVYTKHPVTAEPTLEFKVNYKPFLGPVRRQVIEFAQKCGLKERFVVVDRDGNPVE